MSRFLQRFLILLPLLVASAAPLFSSGDKLEDLQIKFDRESSATHRVKLLEKLGDAQFAETRRLGSSNDYAGAAVIFEKYRDNVRTAFNSLRTEHPDAERNSNGYRQLEIHVRHGLHELEETLRLAPEPVHPPLELVHHDLDEIETDLLQMIFPHHPEPKSPQPPEKQP